MPVSFYLKQHCEVPLGLTDLVDNDIKTQCSKIIDNQDVKHVFSLVTYYFILSCLVG